MPDPDLGAYAYGLMEEVRDHGEMAGVEPDEAFAQLMLEQFSADGHTEDARVVPVTGSGIEVSGWSVSSDRRCLDLFLTRYSPRADEDHKVDRGDALAAFKRMENFLAACVADRLALRDPRSEVADMCASVAEAFADVDRVRLIVITNARSVLREPVPDGSFEGRTVTRSLWDLRRLANWAASGSRAEPIVAEFPAGLPCLATPQTDADYSVFLAIVRGSDLAELYTTHGARLLELNVRSFLQVRGGVNRGILDTLRHSPERFLAYNNGIAATASRVELADAEGGQRVIHRIHDLQVVNGGQTTATIHHARRNRIPVENVLVQMKLTVVSPDKLDDIVPQISAYSNTQNRVTASDLKANSGFHVEVERIMRTLWAPATRVHPHDTHWFYERARGQYANALAREATPARQKVFRTVNPATQKFTKSDLAKFENSWGMLPNLVSLGAEKNFVLFSEGLDTTPVTVDKDYCRGLVAKAILFRRTDKLVAKQNFGGYKANIVTYTVAKLVHATHGRLDLARIWRDQDLTPVLQETLVELAVTVQKIITSPPPGRTHIGEWAKKTECWDAVRTLDWSVPPDLEAELVQVDTYEVDLQAIRGTRPGDWADLAAWGASMGLLDTEQARTATEIAHDLRQGWDPSGRHVRGGAALMRLAVQHGFDPPTGF